MPQGIFHTIKTRLTRCLALALGLVLCLHAPSYAQEASTPAIQPALSVDSFMADPSRLLSIPQDVGQTAMSLLNQGVPPSAISDALRASGVPMDANELTRVISRLDRGVLSSGTMTQQAASQLINGVVSGVIPPNVASALSQIQNLGNIDPSRLAQTLKQQAISGAINTLTPVVAAAAIDGITNILGPDLIQRLSPTQLTSLARDITSQYPAVATALGGQAGIASTLGAIRSGNIGGLAAQLGGGIGGNLTGTGNPFQNPVGVYHSNAGQGTCFGGACQLHRTRVPQDHNGLRLNMKTEFDTLRGWMVADFWQRHMLPALMMMAEQLSVLGMHQVFIIGTFMDAKHQLETQRLLQQMTAQVHKDYHPSEGMCTFGTTVRSLAASERKSDLAQATLSARMMQRQTLGGDVLSIEGENSDIRSRLRAFIDKYCVRADNGNGLAELCRATASDAARKNIDIDFTRNVESRLTIAADFTQTTGAQTTPDEEDVFALAANLYAHNIAPRITPELLASRDQKVRMGAAQRYLDLRSVFAKRSVAQNSFAAIVGMRAEGTPESAPYTKALMRELGVTNPADIDKLLGQNPSYFAQMEVLTKKLYQNPAFYTELYDKPVNVDRKGAAIQAISLMQDRDIYNSLIRSEAVLSVLLETMLMKEQQRVSNAISGLGAGDR